MQKEIFKDIPGYEGLYQISNLGRVKSLPRKMWSSRVFYYSKEKFLKCSINTRGYNGVELRKDNKGKKYDIHQLLAYTFLNHKPSGMSLVVDHIDNNKTNNSLENLQIVTHRVNTSKDKKGSSKYTGVSWHKNAKKWSAQIYFNGKLNHLGLFNCELKASLVYQNKLKELNNK